MANTNENRPYYRSQRRTWACWISGRQVTLGKHPDHLPEPKKGKSGWDPPEEILREYHRRMAEAAEEKPAAVQPSEHPC